MNKYDWKDKIENSCKEAGTYKPYFDSIIDTLAQILEIRDITHDRWVEEGSEPTVIHVNKAGEANSTKNPLLTLENDLNAQALAYWRDLGLSPGGLKKLKADVVVTTEASFEDILKDIADG